VKLPNKSYKEKNMVKIVYECPECGKEITIERKDIRDWGEGFQQESNCPDCMDRVEINYILQPVG
jgi:predicted RNA-binding Zn-ribbon protein involved in translation (DUF1610 family)